MSMKFLQTVWEYAKKNWWHILLLTLSSFYVWICRYEIYDMSSLNAGIVIFLLWVILLLLPLFSQLEFFGIKLRKEVEKATGEVKGSIEELKIQLLQLQVSNSVANTIHFEGSALPSESKMDELISLVKNLPSDVHPNISNSKLAQLEDEDKSVYLFKVRLEIEKILNDLTQKLGYEKKTPMMRMMQILYQGEVIDGITLDLISQVIKIANRGVHGEIVSNEYVDFVRQTYPQIQHQLKLASENLHYQVCPRCKWTGYSRYENVCPKCGCTHDND